MFLYHRLADKLLCRLPAVLVTPAIGCLDLDKRLERARAKAGTTCISFDAFDTLITRPLATPGDLFLVLGHRLHGAGQIDCDPAAWRDARIAAERVARRAAGEREVTLADIYAILARHVPHADAPATEREEIALEHRLTRPVAANIARLHAAAGGPTAILSDIYLPENALRSMLSACGIDLARTEVFASSTTGTTKASGRLFAEARACARHRRGVHVGDNLFADVWRARHAGWRGLPFGDSRPTRLERLAAKAAEGQPLLQSAVAGSMRAARLRTAARAGRARDIAAAASGYAGPVLFAFVVWILARARAAGVERLYFFARDGEILHAIADRVVRHLGLEMDLRYLYVSRQALHLPSLVRFEQDDLQRFMIDAGQSQEDILAKFDLADEGAIDRVRALGIAHAPHAPLSRHDADRLGRTLQFDPVLRERVEARAAVRRKLLLDYLEQEDVLAPGRIGMVDVGWHGNLQLSLCRALETTEPGISDRVHGFYFGLYKRPSGAGRLDAYIDQPEAAGMRPFVRGTMIEVVCTARHGTTLRYARDQSGTVRPVLAAQDNPPAEAWGIVHHQDAICAFADDVLAVTSAAGVSVLDHEDALARTAIAVAAAFVGRPTRCEAVAIGSVPHAADHEHKVVAELSPPLPWNPLLWIARHRRRRDEPMISYWPEASIVRTLPAPIAWGLLAATRVLRERRDGRHQRAPFRAEGPVLPVAETSLP